MRTGRAVVLKAVSDVVLRGTAVITFPILAANVGAAGYGAYGQLNVIVGFIVPFTTLGLGASMVRFFSAGSWSRSTLSEVVKIGAVVAALGTCVTALMAIAAPLLNDLVLGAPSGTELFRWGSLLVVLGAIEFWLLDLSRARGWLIQFSIIQLFQTLALVGAVVVLIPRGYGIIALVQATAGFKALAILGAAGVIVSRADEEPDGEEPTIDKRLPNMIRFGIPLTVAALGGWMVNLSDRLVIGGFLDPADLGRYGAAYTLAGLVALASSPVLLPAYPRLMTAIAGQDSKRIDGEIRLFHRWLTLGLVPIACFLVVIISPLLDLMGGAEFHVAAVIPPLLVAGIFIDQWNGLAHYVLACTDRTRVLQNSWIAAGGLNIALNLVAVPKFGLVGASAATLLSFLALETVIFRAASKEVDLKVAHGLGVSARVAAASAVAAGGSLLTLSVLTPGIIAIVAGTGVFWAIYLLGIALLKELRRSDITLILQTAGLQRGALEAQP